MTCFATSSNTIRRIRGDVDVFEGVDIAAASGVAVTDLLKRAAGLASWLSATQALLISRADVLANPPRPTPPPRPQPDPCADNDETGDSASASAGDGAGAGPDSDPVSEPEPEPAGPSVKDRLTGESNMSDREARRQARRAALLELLVGFHRALLANRVTVEHIDAIVDAFNKATAPERKQFISLANETALEEIAAKESVETFAETVQAILLGLRAETPEQRLQRQRMLSFLNLWTNQAGMTVINGEFDPETGNRIREAIEADLKTLWAANHDKAFPIPDGIHNKAAWLRAQALLLRITQPASGNGAGRSETSSETSRDTDSSTPAKPAIVPLGAPVEIVLFADYDKLAARVASVLGEPCGHFGDGTPVGAHTIRRLACDAAILPMIFKPDGEALDNARRARTANRSQRRALQKMYGGCMFCDAPFNWCEMHHFWHWLDGGPSDLWNLGPLCSHHHHQIHDHHHNITRNSDGTLNFVSATGAIIHTTTAAHPLPPAEISAEHSGFETSDGGIRGTPTQAGLTKSPRGAAASKSAEPDELEAELSCSAPWPVETSAEQAPAKVRGPDLSLF